MDYTEAVNAVDGAPESSPLYGSRYSWPTGQYIGWDYATESLYIVGVGMPSGPYHPTQDDQQAEDWMYGGDKPPR
jgi:hypothetical protein